MFLLLRPQVDAVQAVGNAQFLQRDGHFDAIGRVGGVDVDHCESFGLWAGSGTGPAVQAALDRQRSHAQFSLQLAQGAAQAFLDHRVVKRAVLHLLHGVAALHAPGQQVPDVLGRRAQHLGAQEATGGDFAVDVQRALVAPGVE